jgi:hypothetical protein
MFEDMDVSTLLPTTEGLINNRPIDAPTMKTPDKPVIRRERGIVLQFLKYTF